MPLSNTQRIPVGDNDPLTDQVRIKGGHLNLELNIVTGKQGEYFIHYSPTLNVSGYGKTDKEAEEFMNEQLETFCEDVMNMTKKEREAYLRSLGFKQARFQTKNFSRSYVDMDGKLQDFDHGTLERRVLKTVA